MNDTVAGRANGADMFADMTDSDRRARLILPYFNHELRYGKDIVPPPVIVEFLGPPSSGKSTTKREVDKMLRKQGFRVSPVPEGAESIRYLQRDTPSYNIATGMYAYDILLEETEGHRFDYILFDRCLFDAYSWMKFWLAREKLSPELMHSLQEYFLYGASRIDLAIMVMCEPDVAFQRETRFETTKKLGNFTNPRTMELLYRLNKESFDELSGRFSQLALLDTTALGEIEMVHAAVNLIQTFTEHKIMRRQRSK